MLVFITELWLFLLVGRIQCIIKFLLWGGQSEFLLRIHVAEPVLLFHLTGSGNVQEEGARSIRLHEACSAVRDVICVARVIFVISSKLYFSWFFIFRHIEFCIIFKIYIKLHAFCINDTSGILVVYSYFSIRLYLIRELQRRKYHYSNLYSCCVYSYI